VATGSGNRSQKTTIDCQLHRDFLEDRARKLIFSTDKIERLIEHQKASAEF
jgi:hypothetical protein